MSTKSSGIETGRQIQLRLRPTQVCLCCFLFIFASPGPSTFAQELVSGPVYVTAASDVGTRCDLIEPERHPQLLARFRDSSAILPADGRFTTLQGASTWSVSLSGFSAEAGTAFQFAADVWAARLSWDQTAGPTVSFDTSAQNPSFQAPEVAGDATLTFALTVDDGSASDSDSVNVTVEDLGSNLPPTADAGFDQTVDEGTPVSLDGSGSLDPEDQPLAFGWVQISGPSVTLSDPNAVEPSFFAPQVSENLLLRFRLTVSDGEFSDSDSVDVDVRNLDVNLPPVARAGPDQAVDEGAEVLLDGTGSFDPNGDDLSFEWRQVAGPEATLPDPSSVSNVFAAPEVEEDANLRFQLTVHDGSLSDSDELLVTVRNVETIVHELDFAQFAFGEGLSSELCLLSLSSADSTQTLVTLKTHDGAPWALDLNGSPTVGELEITVPAGGAVRLQTTDAGPIQRGSIKVSSDRALDGLVLFMGPFGLAGIPPGPPLPNGFRTVVETDWDRTVNTGISVANLDKNATTLEIALLNLDGSLAAIADPGNEALQIAGEGQQSFFVTDLSFSPSLDLSRFLGILTATSLHTVGAAAVQTRPGEFAALPVSPGDSGSTTAGLEVGDALDFAQFADGEGLFSQISLLNLAGTTEANAVLLARDEEGEPFPIQLEELSDRSLDASVPANGGRVYQTSAQGPLRAGSLRVESDRPVTGVILFGGEFGVAGVPPGRTMEAGFRTLIHLDDPAGINTGVAIVSLEDQVISLEPRLFHPGGELAAELATDQVLLIPARGQLHFFVTDFTWTLGSLNRFVGILEIRLSGRFAATAVQTRPGQFATLPVARLPE